MNILRLAALLALASIPLLLSRKEKDLKGELVEVDSENIFDEVRPKERLSTPSRSSTGRSRQSERWSMNQRIPR